MSFLARVVEIKKMALRFYSVHKKPSWRTLATIIDFAAYPRYPTHHMASDMDSRKFPRVAQYIDALPEGLGSYPECEANGAAIDYMHSTYPDVGSQTGLPELVRYYWENPKHRTWIPETVASTFYLALLDSHFANYEAYLDWSFESSSALFDTSWARVMMRLLSPTLVVLGAAKRWNAFHRGTTLETGAAKKYAETMRVTGELKYPANLFPTPMLDIFGRAFVAALEGSRAENAAYTLKETDNSTATFVVTWSANA